MRGAEARSNTEQGTADFVRMLVSWGRGAGSDTYFSDGRVGSCLRSPVTDHHQRHTENTRGRPSPGLEQFALPARYSRTSGNDTQVPRDLHDFIVKKSETITYGRRPAARAMRWIVIANIGIATRWSVRVVMQVRKTCTNSCHVSTASLKPFYVRPPNGRHLSIAGELHRCLSIRFRLGALSTSSHYTPSMIEYPRSGGRRRPR